MSRETILEPDLPIVDPHHHLWDRPAALMAALPPPKHGFEQLMRRVPRYLLDELLADMKRGHNVKATVYMECGSMYRGQGPATLKPVGETEFVNGVAAMSASGLYGDVLACAGIVGHADCNLGAAVRDVLEAHIVAGGGRFRGIRQSASADPDKNVLGPLARTEGGLYMSPGFREGFAQLAPLGLSFDAWMLEPQLPDLIDLARAFPETQIILDHVGTPLGIASYAGRREERFPIWKDNIRKLAELPNVAVKLGGLAMVFPGFASFMSDPPTSSEALAAEWKPYIETCIEAFGPDRGMFESNFPVDIGTCDYDVLWNAFKVLAKGASAAEKTALFSGTATKIYRLDL
ncbi:MAG: amidohydrolase family protein [Phenylobacterium sp.]|uniref:amidohydrolase family protein n=1 Tax=Phenylobacterium sp. TaxID=1871053 RepID=UPI002731475B|nr:amidohydrolase family protein [Phenylobacterium sp.]MDP2011289.1 amidohydrolase family protein [Phenylobacterium sp.]MDP3869700.1 amidohydrolase family protein [Phenylobacterium sp.]